MAQMWNYIAILVLIAQTCNGLYEDQINKYDWKKEYIGKVQDVIYDTTLSPSKSLYVATEKNVVASLSSKNGQMNWRQTMDKKIEKIEHFENGILTVLENGILRIWDPNSGVMSWDVNLMAEVNDKSKDFEFKDIAVMDLTYTEGSVVAVLSRNHVFVVRVQVSGTKVKTKVKHVLITPPENAQTRLFIDSESKQILVIHLAVGSSISGAFYDAKTLDLNSEFNIQTAWFDNIKNAVMMEEMQLVYASKEMDALYVLDLEKGKEVSNEPLQTLGIEDGIVSITGLIKNKDVKDLGKDFFLRLQNGGVVHLRIDDQKSLSVVTRISVNKESEILQIDAQKTGNERYYFISRMEKRNLRISGYDISSGKEDTTLALNYNLPEDVGNVDGVYINLFLKKASPVGYRVTLTTSDDCVLMVTLPTRLSWRRDEALASVVVAEMMDLPLSDLEAGIEVEFEKSEQLSIVEMFVNRIKAQIGQINSFARQITKGIKEGTLFEKKTKDPLIQDESMTRDPFSLHKMLVLVTKCGKLFGMDSLSGEVVWRLNYPAMRNKNLKLFIQRTTAHFPNPPLAVLLGTDTESSTTIFLTFNPITGEVEGQELKTVNDILQVMLLPFSDSAYLRPLLLLDKNHDVILVPDTKEIREKVNTVKKSIYLYNVEKSTGKISGYKMVDGMKMVGTYSIRIPQDQEILVVQGKDSFEKIDAMGRPLADRSVIYKYLNPNLILVITGSREASDQTSTITMYLIDAVSGHIMHYATHKKASEPVHAVHTENWVVYTYWNTKARRTEIASYELYEGKSLRNGTSFSSFDHLPNVPVVSSQAYVLGAAVVALGVSKTEKALTSRQLLFGLGRGAIMGLPRRIFDPRRPLNPEQSDREEGLIPYAPEILIHPTMLISYNKTISGIENIYSSPSALESTSIVLVTGLDIFFTRTQPSKMFDVLKEDFEYLLIIAVLSGMFIAAVATRKLAQNKKLNKAWR